MIHQNIKVLNKLRNFCKKEVDRKMNNKTSHKTYAISYLEGNVNHS